MEILSLDLDATTVITLMTDSSPESPRTAFDNLGTLVCWHRRSNMGDTHSFEDMEQFKETVTEEDHIILPVYMYDHGSIALSTTPFSCRFDSGLLGFIYVSKDTVRKMWSTNEITESVLRNVKASLEAEIETYAQYVNGEVYGVLLKDKTIDHEYSCFGLYGEDAMLSYVEDNVPKHFEKIRKAFRGY